MSSHFQKFNTDTCMEQTHMYTCAHIYINYLQIQNVFTHTHTRTSYICMQNLHGSIIKTMPEEAFVRTLATFLALLFFVCFLFFLHRYLHFFFYLTPYSGL